MKRKIIALVAALAIGGSVSAYAATCSKTPAATPVQAVKTAVVCTSAKSANSAVQAVLSKVSSNACNNKSASAATSAVKSQTCQGGSCASKSTCTANSCTNGTTCSKGNCTASAGCGTAAAAKKTCSNGTACAVSGSSCTKGTSSCSGSTCTAGTGCGTAHVCGGSSCSYSNVLNSLLNGACGKTCSGTSCSSAKPASSQTASATPASSSGYSAFQNEVVRLVNAERAKNGSAPLTANAALMNTATLKSQDMVKNNYFSHTSPTYGSPFDLMKKFGISYRTAGENIAMGQTSPSQVMNAWMNSAGHRANILNASYTKIGVGVARNSSGQYYWTQHFIG